MLAEWMATSLPAAPMAIDTSPAASAGASLTPSPMTATRWPAALRESTISSFSCGKTSAL